MSTYLKSLKWSRKTFAPDLMSGLTVALVSIPEGMAYALDDAERWIAEQKNSANMDKI
jgi:MFS superfamily sulfate permease-like transporter